MTALDLDAIKLRAARVVRDESRGGADCLADAMESAGDVPSLVAEIERLRAAADGLNDVFLHWRDRAAGYMAAPPFKSHSMVRGPMAYERAAGLVRDLRDGKLDAAEIERLKHFGEDGPCTAYDYRDTRAALPACPECAAGKHANCDGTTWDTATDALTSCPCFTATIERGEDHANRFERKQ